jgi:hypothetical protein
MHSCKLTFEVSIINVLWEQCQRCERIEILFLLFAQSHKKLCIIQCVVICSQVFREKKTGLSNTTYWEHMCKLERKNTRFESLHRKADFTTIACVGPDTHTYMYELKLYKITLSPPNTKIIFILSCALMPARMWLVGPQPLLAKRAEWA